MEWVSEQTFFLMGITLIVLFLAAELIRPRILTEGFESAIGVLDKNYFTSFAYNATGTEFIIIYVA